MQMLRVVAASLGALTVAALSGPLGCASGSETEPPGPTPSTGTPTAVGAGGLGGAGGAGGGGGSGCLDEELCDGLDNDCDGDIDEECDCVDGDTQPCFSGDPNLIDVGRCAEGEQTCDVHGAWGECEGEVLPEEESCNGEDDDCNGAADDGLNGTVTCGLGACQVTVAECEDGAPVPCVPDDANPTELCEGTDDDCDGDVDEGCQCAENDTQPCYSYAPATRGVGECHDGVQTCDANGDWGPCQGEQGPEQELCNGLDDDCNPATADGAADPAVGVACDGDDSDLCNEGLTTCESGGNYGCSDDDGEHDLELCNGVNDDCNANTADGADEAWLGNICDGAGDTDLCEDGQLVCQGGSPVCNDTTPNRLELCNGVDDDCNPSTADGADESWLGNPCDGTGDTDLCEDGQLVCQGGSPVCSDTTPNQLDLCNDDTTDDCNPSTADGADESWLGDSCDGDDDDLCAQGTYGCSGGVQTCSDANTDDPLCSSGQIFIGTVSGDTGADVVTDNWYDEEWDRISITEDDSSIGAVYLSATVSLYSPPGVDYDLYVYCADCGGTLAGSSATGGLTGHTDVVEVRNDDDQPHEDGFDIVVWINFFDANACVAWELTVSGNTAVSTETCDL